MNGIYSLAFHIAAAGQTPEEIAAGFARLNEAFDVVRKHLPHARIPGVQTKSEFEVMDRLGSYDPSRHIAIVREDTHAKAAHSLADGWLRARSIVITPCREMIGPAIQKSFVPVLLQSPAMLDSQLAVVLQQLPR